METAPPHGDDDRDMHLIAMPYIGINVSDLEASLAFYRKFGYTEVKPLHQTGGDLEEARAYGLDQPFRFRGADIAIAKGDRHVLRLIQWIEPFNPEPPYPPPINRIGINRIAMALALGLLSSPAWAYLDPGTGSMIISAIVGLFATVGLAIKTYWYKLKSLFRKEAEPPLTGAEDATVEPEHSADR